VAGKTATAIRFSRPLLNFGAVSWFDVVLSRFLLNVMTHLMVTAIVLLGIMVIFDIHSPPNMGKAAIALGMAASLALGVGTLNCYLFLAFPAWERIWLVGTRPLFIISGVFFLFEDVPAELRDYLWYNPLFHVTGQMRQSFYATYSADYVSPAFAFGLGLIFLFVGLAALSRNADGLIHK
jgi:capsular polysaccharide transport system permease protein